MIAVLRPWMTISQQPRSDAERAERERERERLELVLGSVAPYDLADRHARELNDLGLVAAEQLQRRLETAVMAAVALEDAELLASEHAQICGDCKRWKLLYRTARVRCCRRARELAHEIDRLDQSYRHAVKRIRGG